MPKIEAQHTLAEVVATLDAKEKVVPATYSTNADTPANKLQIKAEQAFLKALGDFVKAATKGFKGIVNGGLLGDYDVTPHAVRLSLQLSATESREVVNEGPKKPKRKSKPKTPKPVVATRPTAPIV